MTPLKSGERDCPVWFICAVSFTVLLAIAGVCVIATSYDPEIEFDQKSWIADKPYGDRVRMVRRLVRTGELLGKPEVEVSKFLALSKVAHIEQFPMKDFNKVMTMYEINVSDPGRYRILYIYALDGRIEKASLDGEPEYDPKKAASK